MDNSRKKSVFYISHNNGLSDNDAQILTIKNIYVTINKFPSKKQSIRLIDNETVMNFQILLKKETWEPVYIDTDSTHMFNSILCTFLNIFQARFPVKYKRMKERNIWITQGIKINCKQNSFTKNSNDPKAYAYYIKHCEILRKDTKESKKQNYSRIIAKSNNKMTTLNIIQKETGKVLSVEQVTSLLANDEKLKDPTNVANASNKFFITITEKLNIQQREKGDAI